MHAGTPTRDITRYILIAIALVAVALLLWRVVDALVIGFGGIVLATVLRAAAMPISRLTGWSSRWSLLCAGVLLLFLFGLLVWLFGAQASRQFGEFGERLPEAAQKFQTWLERTSLGRSVVDTLHQASGDGKLFSKVGLAAGALVASIGNLLLIVFLGVYFAVDPGLYRRGALRLLPPSRRPQVQRALEDAGSVLHHWLVAQLIVMAAVGILTGIGLAILGVPLALLLGVIVGLLEFVPVVGPIVAAVPAVLLAFAKGPDTAVWVLALYVVVQQLESNVITPIVQRWAVELPPVVALLAIVVGGLLFGPLGVLFATPMAVVVMALVRHLYVEDTLEGDRRSSRPKSDATTK